MGYPRATVPLAVCLLALVPSSADAPDTKPAGVVHDYNDCIIYALREVTVSSSQASGVILDMPVEEGDVLTTDQLIAKLDDTMATLTRDRLQLAVNEKHTLKEAEIRRDQAKAEYDLNKTLRDTMSPEELSVSRRRYLLSEQVVEAAKYIKEVATKRLEEVDRLIERHEIRSPINGVVLKKHREKGESVDADTQTPVVTLIDVSKLRARIQVPVEKIRRIHLNQPATLTCSIFPELVLEGRVAYIQPVVDPGINKFEVKVEFTPPPRTVRPGMRAYVKILEAK